MGIDLGTTDLKICIVGARQQSIRAQVVRRLPVRCSENGGREQSLEKLDRAFRESIGELKNQLGDDWKKIQGIGVAAQAGSTIIADRRSGKAITPMILWNDGRAHERIHRLSLLKPRSFWRKHTLLEMPPAGLGRLLWLKESRPELFDEKNIHIGAGEYLYFKLTGTWLQDAGNALQIGSYDAARGELTQSLFDLIEVPLSFVAPLRFEHQTTPLSKSGARLLGLPDGIPIAGPYWDQEAGFMSAASASERPLQCSLGTAWVGNFILPKGLNGKSPYQLVVPAPVHSGKLVVQPLLTGNTAWDWALRETLGSEDKETLQQAANIFKRRLLPPRGLKVIPWFTQQNFFYQTEIGAGVIAGLRADMNRFEILRAVAAGMTFELRRVFDALKQTGTVDSLVLNGGACQAIYFRRLIKALFSPVPVNWQPGGGLAVSKGAICAFDPIAAQTRIRQIPESRHDESEDILRAYETYLNVFERVCGSIGAGKAFRIHKRLT